MFPINPMFSLLHHFSVCDCIVLIVSLLFLETKVERYLLGNDLANKVSGIEFFP